MDKNRDGSISLDEFINCYIEGEIRLKERLNEIIKAIVERRRQIDEFQQRLTEAKVKGETKVLANRKTQQVWDHGKQYTYCACALS